MPIFEIFCLTLCFMLIFEISPEIPATGWSNTAICASPPPCTSLPSRISGSEIRQDFFPLSFITRIYEIPLQMNSLTTAFLDFQYFICFYATEVDYSNKWLEVGELKTTRFTQRTG